MEVLTRQGATLVGSADWRKGSTWVLERDGGRFWAARRFFALDAGRSRKPTRSAGAVGETLRGAPVPSGPTGTHRRVRQRDAMADLVTPLPAAKAFAEDERSVLLGYLAYHRAVLARKAEGLSDEQARRPCPPSTLTLLGLIRHMTDVERWWFRRVLLAEDIPVLFDDEQEWQLPTDATVAGALADYWKEIAVIDRRLADASMDDPNVGGPDAGRHKLRGPSST